MVTTPCPLSEKSSLPVRTSPGPSGQGSPEHWRLTEEVSGLPAVGVTRLALLQLTPRACHRLLAVGALISGYSIACCPSTGSIELFSHQATRHPAQTPLDQRPNGDVGTLAGKAQLPLCLIMPHLCARLLWAALASSSAELSNW